MNEHQSKFGQRPRLAALTAATLLGISSVVFAAPFDSGSICATNAADPKCLGAFNPTIDTVIDLPPDGILHYTTFTVNAGRTISFRKNAANTPVTILASGNVTINGLIYVTPPVAPTPSGQAGDGTFGDDGKPGKGGPGGFDGGAGGIGPLFGGTTGAAGGGGYGPGGGQAGSGTVSNNNSNGVSGGGGAFNAAANGGYWAAGGGTPYGQWSLLPLIGGSGGGGGAAGSYFTGGGGGGGGGAILIASSATIYIGGGIYADGGGGAQSLGTACGGGGAGGAGGAIRLVAERLDRGWVSSPGGYLYARGGGGAGSCQSSASNGGAGFIRLEANTLTNNWSTGYSDPGYSFALPGKVFVPNNPSLSITSVAGVAVPANPTGVADITLPANTTMPVTIAISGTNIPVGTGVKIYLVQTNGARSEVSPIPALAGPSDAATTASASVTFTPGNTTILVSATYTVTELLAASLPKFGNEYVAKIRVDSEMGGKSKVVYITASGKEYPADGRAVKAAS
jgi:hypothetical protein